MTAARIVMRPVNDRQAPWVVHHFSPDLNPVADRYRTTRGDRNIIDDLDRAGYGAGLERFVHRMRSTPEEEARRGADGRVEIDLRRSLLRVCVRDVHRRHRSRRGLARQEAVCDGAKERAK